MTAYSNPTLDAMQAILDRRTATNHAAIAHELELLQRQILPSLYHDHAAEPADTERNEPMREAAPPSENHLSFREICIGLKLYARMQLRRAHRALKRIHG